MRQLHAVIVEQPVDLDPTPRHGSLAPMAKGYRFASVVARFVVSATLVGGVALSFAFGDNDRVLAGGLAVSPVR